MDTDQLNRWLTLGANIGVLVGIALLLVELKQTREATRAETRSNISQNISNLISQIALDQDMAELRYRADSGGELTEVEAYRYRLLQGSLFRYMESVHFQYRLGLYDESEFAAQKRSWAGYINGSKRAPDFWCSIRDMVSDDFAREIDSVVEASPCIKDE